MAAKQYKFKVEMTCGGCSDAIERILKKHQEKGVESFEIDLENKLVSVTSNLPADQVLEIIKKSGKGTTLLDS